VLVITFVSTWSGLLATLALVLPWIVAFTDSGVAARVRVTFADGLRVMKSTMPRIATAAPAA